MATGKTPRLANDDHIPKQEDGRSNFGDDNFILSASLWTGGVLLTDMVARIVGAALIWSVPDSRPTALAPDSHGISCTDYVCLV